MRWNYTPASLQADTNGLVQQARSKRFNKTSKASAISTAESAASRGAKSHSNQTWSHTSAPTVNRIAIYLESNVKWQNMTEDYIISIVSSGLRCAAVDLSISILLLPPAVLHNKADNSPLGNQQSGPKKWNCQRLLETVDRDLECVAGYCTWALSLDCLSDVMADDLQTSQVPPTKTSWTTWRTSSEYCASLRSSTSQSERKRLETSCIPWTKAELKDICHTLLDLEWRGVGFLDLAIVFLRVVWNAGATSNINSWWKHPI